MACEAGIWVGTWGETPKEAWMLHKSSLQFCARRSKQPTGFLSKGGSILVEVLFCLWNSVWYSAKLNGMSISTPDFPVIATFSSQRFLETVLQLTDGFGDDCFREIDSFLKSENKETQTMLPKQTHRYTEMPHTVSTHVLQTKQSPPLVSVPFKECVNLPRRIIHCDV